LPDDIFQRSFATHLELIHPTELACREPLERLGTLVAASLRDHGKLFLFGNGGSAADAQHLAAEFTVRLVKDRRALAAIALTTDTSALTACGNDLGFDRIFSRQIEALGRPGDVALGISTSGNSPGVISALEVARKQGMTAAAFSGNTGGKLRGIADPLVVVPSGETARIQEMHILLGHILCAEVERHLGLG
jgi:D-sedoheptulose 7-phosphate isomerase